MDKLIACNKHIYSPDVQYEFSLIEDYDIPPCPNENWALEVILSEFIDCCTLIFPKLVALIWYSSQQCHKKISSTWDTCLEWSLVALFLDSCLIILAEKRLWSSVPLFLEVFALEAHSSMIIGGISYPDWVLASFPKDSLFSLLWFVLRYLE